MSSAVYTDRHFFEKGAVPLELESSACSPVGSSAGTMIPGVSRVVVASRLTGFISCVLLRFSPGKILEEAFSGDDGWKLLDAYTPTVLRADSHRGATSKRWQDCLHYCNPGPVDHWVTLLYNILLVETTGGKHQ